MDRWLLATRLGLGRLWSRRRPRSVSGLILMAGILAGSATSARAGWEEEIGLIRLQARLGKAMPTGGSISVSQVEMGVNDGDYLPDRHLAYFAGKSINVRSGDSGFSRHATIVGQHYFGVGSSPAHDIHSADIYEANAWINHILRVNSSDAPVFETGRVQNHSWVGTLGSTAMDTDALRRVDWVVQRDGVLVAAGLNNGHHTPVPRLVSSAYNVVTVGLTNGDASRGATLIEGIGRVKPDLVAPLSATSWATPVVAASGALLLESSESLKALSYLPADQQRPARVLLVKTLLMGGATKHEWPDWRRGFSSPCTDGSVPLDYRYGAGELNIDNSFRILAAGECNANASGVAPLTGWDWDNITPAQPRRYQFEIPPDSRATEASITAVWNRQIHAAPGSPLRLTASLPNIDLRLYAQTGAGRARLVDASTSRIDNVEHIYLKGLTAGRYLIELRSDRASEYCLTWDVALASGLQVDSQRQPRPADRPVALAVAP